jgi:uncharacterized NAD(P)/FAD-binding protein YdhS
MRSDAGVLPVAIVGGGFSGTMTAAQLSRRGVASVLIDGSGRLGRGVAYSTGEPVHLLNVTTDKMTAWPEQPRDFAAWCSDEGTGFAERRAFGAYLGEQLAEAENARPVEAMAVGAERDGDGWRVRLDDGRELAASALVLALGNQPPAPFSVAADLPSSLFVNNPWSPEAKAAVDLAAASGSDVLILGTGLTMIDTVLSLAAGGHQGRITALSRRGLVPRAHVHPPYQPAPIELADVPLGSVTKLWRWLRRRSAEVGFRATVDALRPHSHAVWQSLPEEEQDRFLRHARPWWDVHRHRIAPQVASQLKDMIAAGQLEIVAGRLRSLDVEGAGLQALVARRGGGTVERRVGVAFNCTGPLGDMRRTADPVLARLLASGEVKSDRFALSLEVDERSRAGGRLWALGPLTKGRYWEIIAVPDIRGQVAAVADDIAAELGANDGLS